MTGRGPDTAQGEPQGTLHINKVDYQGCTASLVLLLTYIALINLSDEESFKIIVLKHNSLQFKICECSISVLLCHEIMNTLIAQLPLSRRFLIRILSVLCCRLSDQSWKEEASGRLKGVTETEQTDF